MTVNEVFGLRNQGRTEEAYEAAREIYATDKSPYASSAMFWTAVDMMRMWVNEGRMEEAARIFTALERLLSGVRDEKGWMHDAMKKCKNLLEKAEKRKHLLENGPEHLQMGIWGEELAVAFLRERKYVILERNWHSKHRDIDIIAQQGDCIVFVEVKTRRNRVFSNPIYAINYQKQKNLRISIEHYLRSRKIDNPWRFDIITIVGEQGDSMPEIEHIENCDIFDLR